MSSFPFGFGEPCLPTRVEVAPSGRQWVHEIKHDGYRLMVRQTPQGVRIKTRRGFDWTDRFPVIIEAAGRLRATSFVLDGEGVILGPDGVSDFDRLQSRRHDHEVQLLGFDLLELDSVDLRRDPLDRRKAALAKLLRRSHDGIQLVEHIEAADGATVFAHACRLGLEGIVSKRRYMPYQHGRSRAWVKAKNPESPAMQRVWAEPF
jgi:ATP-dependent DNA ligase